MLIEMLAPSSHGGLEAKAAEVVCDLPGKDAAEGKVAPALAPADDDHAMTAARAPVERSYFVSPDGNDAWSGLRPDAAENRSDGPFATIERARDAIRQNKQALPSSFGKTIYLRGGRYALQRPVVFTSQDSGVRIVAYRGERPELTGATSVTAIHKDGEGRFTASLASDPGREIFVGPTRQTLSVKPGPNPDGWQRAGVSLTPGQFSFQPGAIDQKDGSPGVGVELLDTGRSQNIFTQITSLDAVNGVANVAPSDRGPVSDIGSFRLIGNPAWIAREGQFGWDGSRHLLTLDPSDAAALAHDGVHIPTLSSLFVFQGSRDNLVSGLNFVETGTAPESERDSAAIVLDQASRITVADNRFHNVGQAIRLITSQDNFILRNSISEMGASGIELQDGSDRNLVGENTLTGIGRIKMSAAAIYLHGAGSNRIARNSISHVARHGIGIDNWDDKTINIGNIVEYNRVLHTNEETADTGAIEMLGRSGLNTKSVVRFNDIRDAGKSALPQDYWPDSGEASGIYLDDLTSGVLVCGNRILGAPLSAIQVHGGSNIVIRDNVAILDRPDAAFVFFQGSPPRSGGQRYDFTWHSPGSKHAGLPNDIATASAVSADSGPFANRMHRVEIRFDNDTVINGEDRDLFVSRIEIGARTVEASDPKARYLVDDGRVLPGQEALPWNGTLQWDLPSDMFGPDVEKISVFAWSNPAAGVGAHFVLSVDGAKVGEDVAAPPPSEMRDIAVTRNILYATAPGARYYKDEHGGTPTIKGNAYFDRTGGRRLKDSGVTDSQPLLTNPEFIDPERGDFRLRPSSGLRSVGFGDLPKCPTNGALCPDQFD